MTDLHTWDPTAVATHDVIAHLTPRGPRGQERSPEIVIRAIDGVFQGGTRVGGAWIRDTETLDEALRRAGYQRVGAWDRTVSGDRASCRARSLG